jgi:hypothetical protein
MSVHVWMPPEFTWLQCCGFGPTSESLLCPVLPCLYAFVSFRGLFYRLASGCWQPLTEVCLVKCLSYGIIVVRLSHWMVLWKEGGKRLEGRKEGGRRKVSCLYCDLGRFHGPLVLHMSLMCGSAIGRCFGRKVDGV